MPPTDPMTPHSCRFTECRKSGGCENSDRWCYRPSDPNDKHDPRHAFDAKGDPMTPQPSGWHEFCGMWICSWCEIALDAPAEHVCRPGPARVPSPATERDPDCPNCKHLEQQIEGLKLSLKRVREQYDRLYNKAMLLPKVKRQRDEATATLDVMQGKRHAS